MASKTLEYFGMLADDDELILVSAFQSSVPPPIFLRNERLQLDRYSDQQCKRLFRFEKNDIFRLRRALRIEDRVRCSNGTALHGVEALCVFLRRMTYPNRLEDQVKLHKNVKERLKIHKIA